MTDTILAQIAALEDQVDGRAARQMWRELFDREPPVLGRRYLEDRLAYQRSGIALRRALRSGPAQARRPGRPARAQSRPPARSRAPDRRHAAGARVEGRRARRHRARARFRVQRPAVQVVVGGRESRSPNTRWNGWVFFGLRRNGTSQMNAPPRKIRCAIYCRKSSEEGLDQAFNSLHAQRESLPDLHRRASARGLDRRRRPLRRPRLLWRDPGAPGAAAAAARHRGRQDRHGRLLQDRPAEPIA